MRTTIASLIALASLSGACAMLYQAPPTPLADAAWRGDLAEVRRLVKGGGNINELHGAPLLMAARGGHPIGPHQCAAEDPSRPAMVAAMLELGANPNERDGRSATPGGSSGWTALFVALHHRQWKTAAVLLEHGADPGLKSDQGMTVIDMAQAEGAPGELINLIKSRPEVRGKT